MRPIDGLVAVPYANQCAWLCLQRYLPIVEQDERLAAERQTLTRDIGGWSRSLRGRHALTAMFGEQRDQSIDVDAEDLAVSQEKGCAAVVQQTQWCAYLV